VFTRCPGCHTVHPVNAALLAVGGGRYRCGKCNKVSNALECLFDEWPQAGARATAPGEMPVLGLALDLEAAARSRQDPDAASLDEAADAGKKKADSRAPWLLRATWICGAFLVLTVVVWKWAEFQGKPLLERPDEQAAAVRQGLQEAPPDEPFRDLDQVHLVSRELTSHPFLSGHLRLSATIVNRATRSQPYPDIEVALLDAAGNTVLNRRFTPEDYLDPERAPGTSMAPQAYLPLTLDMEDPGVKAVGFELQFK
jgi:predicted Zn finger-like uncharacterized protein